MAQRQVGDVVVRALEVLGTPNGDAVTSSLLDAFLRAHDGGACQNSVQPCHLHNGRGTALLHIQSVRVFTGALHHKPAEEPDRRFAARGQCGEMRVEALRATRGHNSILMHALRHLLISKQTSEIKEHLGIQQRLRLRSSDPPVEGSVPLTLRHPPLRRGRHHVARTQRLPGIRKAHADVVGEALEVVAVCGFVIKLGQHQRVVLIRSRAHLPPCLRAHSHKSERHRRRAKFFIGQLSETPRNRIRNASEKVLHIACRRPPLHKPRRHRRRALVRITQLFPRAAGHIRSEVDRVRLELVHDVTAGQHTDDLRPRLHDRKVVDAVLTHHQHGFKEQGFCADGAHWGGHDVGDGRIRRKALRNHTPTQIAVGENADLPVLVPWRDHDARHVTLRHPQSCIADGCRSVNRDQVAGLDHLADVGAERVRIARIIEFLGVGSHAA